MGSGVPFHLCVNVRIDELAGLGGGHCASAISLELTSALVSVLGGPVNLHNSVPTPIV